MTERKTNMIEALTYDEMIRKINENVMEKGIIDDYIAVLFTRPDLETGKSIANSLNYYHHMTGNNINFYLPGYSAYGGEQYITEVDRTPWYFCTKEFVKFYEHMEHITKWKYSGESDLLLLELSDGELQYSQTMEFYLDNMLRDNVIASIPSFMQKLSGICREKETIKEVSNYFGRNKAKEIGKNFCFDKLPDWFGDIFEQEKYFCVRNIKR